MSLSRWTVRDQGTRLTCLAFSLTACVEAMDYLRDELSEMYPHYSAQFLYWAIKVVEGPPAEEVDGADFTSGANGMRTWGVPPEAEWPYEDANQRHPESHEVHHGRSPDVPSESARSRAKSWCCGVRRVKPGTDLIEAVKKRHAVAASIRLFRDDANPVNTSNWGAEEVRENNGWVPDPDERAVPLGIGHAVCLVGYHKDDTAPGGGWYIVRNSWGTKWGGKFIPPGASEPLPAGYAAISRKYIEEHAECFVVDKPPTAKRAAKSGKG